MRRFCVVALGAMLACVAVAQQAPAAPIVLFARVSSGTGGGGGGGGGGSYTCANALVGTTGVECATLPTTSSSATVNPSTIAANIVSGRALTVQNGTYGDITFDGVSDISLVIQSSATLGYLRFRNGATRISIECETPRACTTGHWWFEGSATSHITFNNIHEAATESSAGAHDNDSVWYGPTGSHVTILNSLIRNTGYCALIDRASHIVIGNTDMDSTSNYRPCLRMMSVTNSVVADSRLANSGGSSHIYRIHAESGSGPSGNNYAMRTLFIQQGIYLDASGGSGGGESLGVQYVRDSCAYATIDWFWSTGSGANRATVGHVNDNAGFGSAFMAWPSAGAFQSDDISGNTVSAYTTPPTFTYDGTACS